MLITYLNFWFSIQGISQIIEIFEKEKCDIRFVGGCVRDAFLGNKSSDIDLSINCNPDITSKIIMKNNIEILEYGKKYGTITAVINRKNFEITSLREDKKQSGRYTEVQFTDDWQKDALRRDFTFNAISMTYEGKIFDYFEGQRDLKLQQIKFIGNISERIKEDYLRIMRYFRFLGLFEKPIMITGYEKILNEQLPNLRKHVSNNRIREELIKMLKNNFKINSLVSLTSMNKSNDLIKTIREWWIEDKYELGLKTYINRIDKSV